MALGELISPIPLTLGFNMPMGPIGMDLFR